MKEEFQCRECLFYSRMQLLYQSVMCYDGHGGSMLTNIVKNARKLVNKAGLAA